MKPQQSLSALVTGARQMIDHFLWVQRLLYRSARRLFYISWANALVSTVLPAITAIAVRGLVNALVDGDPRSAVFRWLLLGFAATFATVVTGSIFRNALERVRVELGYVIRSTLLEHSARLPLAELERPAVRDQMGRAFLRPDSTLAEITRIGMHFVTRGAQALSLLAILIVIEPIIFLLLLPVGIPYIIYQMRLVEQRFAKSDALAESRRWIDYYSGLLSSEHQIAEVKLFKLAPLLLTRLRGHLATFRQIERDFLRGELIGMLLYALASVVAIYLALSRAVLATIAGDLSIGDIAIYGSATTQLRSLVELLLKLAGELRWELLNINRIREFLAITPETASDAEPNRPAPAIGPPADRRALEFRNVTYTYPGRKQPTLAAVSFHIDRGETVALVGENGAGKTTIAKLIARFYDPDAGCVLLNSVDLRQIDRSVLRDQVTFVLQHFVRYAATAAENLAFGDWQRLLDDRQAIEALAAETDVLSLIEQMPDGFDTMLGRTFGSYSPSGGEWQQLAIARALGRNSDLLILDEPTASLDARREFELLQQYRRLARERTTLLISHRFSTVRIADRILVVDSGRIVESGTHDELIALGGKYQALYDLHVTRLAG